MVFCCVLLFDDLSLLFSILNLPISIAPALPNTLVAATYLVEERGQHSSALSHLFAAPRLHASEDAAVVEDAEMASNQPTRTQTALEPSASDGAAIARLPPLAILLRTWVHQHVTAAHHVVCPALVAAVRSDGLCCLVVVVVAVEVVILMRWLSVNDQSARLVVDPLRP